jgi:hypothetical protein
VRVKCTWLSKGPLAYHLNVPENHLIRVLADAGEQQWPLSASRRGRDWLIRITSPDGTSWAAEGPDLFKALRALRRILDPLGIRLATKDR